MTKIHGNSFIQKVREIVSENIATLINGSMNEENMRTVITFDKGGTWEFLQAPAFTGYGEKISCEV